MNKSKVVFSLFGTLVVSVILLISLLNTSNVSKSERTCHAFISLTTLPDLAIANSAASLRHRTLFSSETFEPTLLRANYESFILSPAKRVED